ncbi:MAG TPA: hypothetical protein VG105_14335 [Paraburkholderia sp.]|jgi:hypothetical protein|nr:hypothetical protein [Paraburkholderia sp.]
MSCTASLLRRMRIIDHHRHLTHPRTLCAVLAIALILTEGVPRTAHAAPVRYTFAVIAGTMQSPADEASTQRLIDAMGRERDLSFIVYDGNLKGAKEACRDSLYERREALLEAARPPLVFIPGQHDWADCGTAEAGGFDPVERLDQLRQTAFAEASSMGQNPIPLTRESEVSRFRPYRENVRWQLGDTVFVGLNVPGPNNHYLTAGGRNGEFEDRVIANAFWLEHAAEYAKRRDARAIVVFVQGDPDPERYERPDRFAWLRFARNSHRDGFLELKRSLVKLAQIFRGPVLLIHCDDERPAGGFVIDRPLRNDKGEVVTNLTRIAFAPHDRLNQWIQIEADMARRPPFRVSVREVPKNLPLLPVQPVQPAQPSPASEEAAPALPPTPALNPSLNPASNLPPLLPTPPQPELPPGAPGDGSEAPASTGMPASSVQRGP